MPHKIGYQGILAHKHYLNDLVRSIVLLIAPSQCFFLARISSALHASVGLERNPTRVKSKSSKDHPKKFSLHLVTLTPERSFSAAFELKAHNQKSN